MYTHELKAFENMYDAESFMNECEKEGKEVMSCKFATIDKGFSTFVVWVRWVDGHKVNFSRMLPTVKIKQEMG